MIPASSALRRSLSVLLVPWHVLRLASGAKAFSDNPVIGSRRLNRRGLHAARVRIAAAMATHRRRGLAHALSADDVRDFDRDGFVEVRDFLPRDVFDRLRDAVLGYAGAARETVQGDTVTRRIALDREAMAALPEAHALTAHPRWRGLVRYAASHDAEPLVYIQSILSGARDGEPDPQTVLHSDTFHASAKAWLFLTDVAADEGPFCYVPGSHRATPRRLAWERARSIAVRDGDDRLSARGSLRIGERDLAALGLPPPRRFAVPANTLIVADTHGFHARGPSARSGVRIEIWAYCRRNPFLPWRGFDVTGIPGIAERRIGWMWGLRDRLERVMGQPWRAVGRRRPGDPADTISAQDRDRRGIEGRLDAHQGRGRIDGII